MKSSKLLDLKPKKKCCRSRPRCKRCPVVVHHVHKAERNGIRGKDLVKVFRRARRGGSSTGAQWLSSPAR